nr:NB-ARC domain-containing protein [Streptomyces roseifaciens]
MGGVGKTQLAAHHARRAWEEDVDLLVWVTAATREAITDTYAQAAREILHDYAGDPGLAAEAFLAWLEPKASTEQCRWLIVLDDVADPADLRGLWPPASPSGRTLVTTRRQDAALTGAGRRLIRVGLFTPSEAVAYLTTSLEARKYSEGGEQLAGLAADLGYLPLALSQAAAYLADAPDLNSVTYRHLLADRARTLADALPEPGALPDDQAVTVAATWSLSIDRADRMRPRGLARPMLHLAAMLGSNGIPISVLTSPPALTHLTENRTAPGWGPQLQQRVRDEVGVEGVTGALRVLQRMSLIDHSPDSPHQTVRVHQLVQRAVRESLRTDQCDLFARAAADALTAAWPRVEHDTALAQSLRANADALLRHAQDALFGSDAHPVLPHRVQSRRSRTGHRRRQSLPPPGGPHPRPSRPGPP